MSPSMPLNAILIFTSVLLGISGCASPTPRLDAQFGTAVQHARQAQTLNRLGPQAEQNAKTYTSMGHAEQTKE